MEPKWKDPLIDAFFEAILKLETIEECYRFFDDVATISEIKALAQRLEVARLLRNNETYTYIAQVTGASTATISRVKRCLYFGSDGYQLILNRLYGEPPQQRDYDKEEKEGKSKRNSQE